MNDPEKQTQADELLVTYRCILSYCLQEQAKFSAAYITPDIAQRIDETYAYIQQLKTQMRAVGLKVIDRPGDEPPTPTVVVDRQPPGSVPVPASDRQPLESDARPPDADRSIAGVGSVEALELPYQVIETMLFPAARPEPPPPPLPSEAHVEPRDVGDYRLFEPIAHQEHAIVYRAAHRQSNWPVQIHVLRPTDTVTRDLFRQAARLMMRVRHPNILPILALGEDEQLGDYLVTPPIATRTLQELLAHGPLDPLLALRVFAQIGAALDELRGQGVRRCDLQPATILVAPSGVAYLTSFSLAEFDTA